MAVTGTKGFRALFLFLLLSCTRASDWSETKALVRGAFPEVPFLSTAELARWLAGDPASVLLLDVRMPEEYVVSHIPGAHLAPTVEEALRLARAAPEGTRVVLYCSVGYRSGRMARELLKRGLSGIYNLEGSIFAWANEGRPLTDGKRAVERVHPFNEKWGRLLDPRHRAGAGELSGSPPPPKGANPPPEAKDAQASVESF